MIRTTIIISALFFTGCAHISLPNLNGTCPAGYPVKGNESSHLYHIPESPYYAATRAEYCFDTPLAAHRNGFIAPKR